MLYIQICLSRITLFFIMTVLPPWLAGLAVAGVAGAIQSTVGAMIIIISSAIVKDAYRVYINPKAEPEN